VTSLSSLVLAASSVASSCRTVASSGAIVARDFTAAGLAEAIGTLSESGHTWSKISQSSRKWCEEFGSWETSEKRLLDVYKTIEIEESSIK
jgi:hypothetical protein